MEVSGNIPRTASPGIGSQDNHCPTIAMVGHIEQSGWSVQPGLDRRSSSGSFFCFRALFCPWYFGCCCSQESKEASYSMAGLSAKSPKKIARITGETIRDLSSNRTHTPDTSSSRVLVDSIARLPS